MVSRPQRHDWRRIYPALLLGLSLVHLVLPQRTGILALTEAVAPYLFLPALLLVPFAFLRGAVVLRWALAVCALVFGLRLSPALNLTTPSNDPDACQVKVMNWNVGRGAPSAEQVRVRRVLETRPADIIALEEAQWEWMQHDPVVAKLYPYQLKHTHQASSGLVLLSSYPMLEQGVAENPPDVRGWPRLIWTRLDLGQGRQLLVVAAHTESPYSSIGRCQLPPCYDTSERDSLVPRIRAVVDPALRRGQRVLLLGDFNVTHRELTYRDLLSGLQDAHRQVGRGTGHTWGIVPEIGWRWPLLRIEYLFSSPGVTPLRTGVDCAPRGSDHCILHGSFAID